MIQNSYQYAVYPKIAWQRPSPTDVQEEWVGCSSTKIKEFGNNMYRATQTPVDTSLVVLLPVLIVALCIFFFAYFAYLVRNWFKPKSDTPTPDHSTTVPGSNEAIVGASATNKPTGPIFSLTQTFGLPPSIPQPAQS
jgi:hypothetical protein